MGLFSALSNLFAAKGPTIEVLVLGLDNSGKTTIVNQLKPPDQQSSNLPPTVGHNVDKFNAGGTNFLAYDMSGQSRLC